MAPALHLPFVLASLTVLGAEFGGVQASSLEYHHEFVRGAPTLGGLLRCRRQLSLQPSSLPPVVAAGSVNAQRR